MLPRFAKQTIVLVTPALIEERGEMVEDWVNSSRDPVELCSVQPGNGDADYEHADSLTADYTIYMPPETALPPSGFRVELPGIADGQFVLQGEPQPWIFGMRTDNIRVRVVRRKDGMDG